MRTMGKAVGLLLAIAFVAGVWQARYGREDGPGGVSGPFRSAPVERSRSPRTAPELRSVEALERQGSDRVVFTFQGSRPGYRVRYVPKVTTGDGRRLPLRGQAFLEVRFDPARAHDPAGRPTFPAATLTPGSPVVREVRLAGDFEGRVWFGIGLAGRGGFRVADLGDPTRIAIDVAA
jgi:hypothetical protein